MRLRFQLFSLSLISVCLLHASASAEKLLRWDLRPGQTLQVTLDQNFDMSTSLMDHDMRSSSDLEMTLIWNVRNVDGNGVAQIDQSIDRLAMKMSTPGNDRLEYDSTAPLPADGIARQWAESVNPLVGVHFTQQMTNRGELAEPRLTEESAPSLPAVGSQVKETISHEGLKSLISQAATVLPQRPVKPGDSWQGCSKINSPAGTLIMQTNYTYRGTENQDGRPLERIDLEITLKFGDGPNAMGLDVRVSNQKNSGTIYFDAALGHFVRSEIVQQMKLVTQLGEQVHRQQLNTTLRMSVSETGQLANRSGAGNRR